MNFSVGVERSAILISYNQLRGNVAPAPGQEGNYGPG